MLDAYNDLRRKLDEGPQPLNARLKLVFEQFTLDLLDDAEVLIAPVVKPDVWPLQPTPPGLVRSVAGDDVCDDTDPELARDREPDLAAALDDRIRLRHLMEGMRSRLSARELQAASLCYLQGLPRAHAAAQMGVSDAAMRRLMDGRRGRAGVAQKVGSLVGTISS